MGWTGSERKALYRSGVERKGLVPMVEIISRPWVR